MRRLFERHTRRSLVNCEMFNNKNKLENSYAIKTKNRGSGVPWVTFYFGSWVFRFRSCYLFFCCVGAASSKVEVSCLARAC